MKTIILALLFPCVCNAQLIDLDKDTTYNETVRAKFYLYVNDTTLKIVYGLHKYSVHIKTRGAWHELRPPDFSESYSFDEPYLNENVLKVEDLEEPVIYNLMKRESRVIYQ